MIMHHTLQSFAKRGSPRVKLGLGLAVGFLIAGCSSALMVPSRATPAQIGALEEKLAREPGSEDARIQLAAAYRATGRPADAATLLEPVVRNDPEDPSTLFLLAMSYEGAGRLTDARRTYESYLASNGPASLNRRAESRLARIERSELEKAVRDAISSERSIGAATIDTRSVGIFPFVFSGSDPNLEPLGKAVAELLTADLSQTDRLRVLERAQMQFLLDELTLPATSAVDPATAARAGRIMGAGQLVQGRIDGTATDLRIQSILARVNATRDSTDAPLVENGPVSSIFDIEKRLALSIYSAVGVQLTVAERERVMQRHTDNVQALLAFGLGLEADDHGQFGEAMGQFESALEFDGGFTLARIWLERVRRKAGDGDGLGELAELELGWGLPGWQRRRLQFASIDPMVPDPDLRNPLPEVIGTECLDCRARAIIIIRQPGGR
jgi:tetratricopeptide (TPR) repeat protein